MLCPKCQSGTYIEDNRSEPNNNEVYRLHKCKNCGHTFHTIEFEVIENEQFKKLWASISRSNKGYRSVKDVKQHE